MNTTNTQVAPAQANVTQSLHHLGRFAGVLYLIIIITGIFAAGYARPSLVVSGDAAATAGNIIASEGLFRISIVSDLIMIVCDIAIGLVFYLLLRPVNQGLSLLSALFRLAQAAALGINLLMLFLVLQLLSGAEYLGALGTDQVNAQALLFLNAHDIGYKIALVFFAFSILIQGYLLYRSGYFPRILGILMFVASMAYLLDSFATFVLSTYDAYSDVFEMIVMPTALISELALCLWLLVKGISIKQKAQLTGTAATRIEALPE